MERTLSVTVVPFVPGWTDFHMMIKSRQLSGVRDELVEKVNEQIRETGDSKLQNYQTFSFTNYKQFCT